ncbi:hypothetical protein ABZP36_002433 [Zizania latifolia]
MMFVCFSGAAAAVADEEVAAAAAAAAADGARHRSGRRRGSMPSLRSRFMYSASVGKGRRSSAAGAKRASPDGRELVDDGCYDGATSASSVPSSPALSSSPSLDLACSYYYSSSTSCSGSLSSSSFSEAALAPPHAARRQGRRTTSPTAGAAAVLVCLVMVMLCGRVGATVLASAAFYLFPRRWPATTAEAESAVVDVTASPVHDAPSASDQETMKRKVVMHGFLTRNRKK